MIFVNLYEDRFDRVILVAKVISTKILYIVLNENRDSSSALVDLYLCIAL